MALTPEEKRQLALSPKSLTTAAGSRTAHSLREVKELLDEADEQETLRRSLPIRRQRHRPPGAV